MFETSTPLSIAHPGSGNAGDRGILPGDSASESVRGGDALRAIEWRELTARLNAARELRRELREEAILCAGASGATFGDAAARFFNSLANGESERPVNPDALEACKSSCDIPLKAAGAATRGDARDDL